MKTCCFMTNMIQTFCDTDITFCVIIPKEHRASFSEQKKKKKKITNNLLCAYGQLCQLIFYTCLTRVEISVPKPESKTV